MATLQEVQRRIYDPQRAKRKTGGSLRGKALKGAGRVGAAAVPIAVGGGILEQEDLPVETIQERGGFVPSVAKSTVGQIPGGQTLRKLVSGVGAAAAPLGPEYAAATGREAVPLRERLTEVPGAFMQGFTEEERAIGKEQTRTAPTQIDITEPARVAATLRDAQGEPVLGPGGEPVGEISAPTEYHRALREQLGTAGMGPGGVSVVSPEAAGDIAVGTQAREAVLPALQAAIARGEDVDIERYLGDGPRQATTAERIQELEGQLEQPGRGLRQSLGDAMQERRQRNNIRRQLKQLYKQQETETEETGRQTRAAATAARQDRTFALQQQRFGFQIQQAEQKAREGRLKDAASDFNEFSKEIFPDDPERQRIYTAKKLQAINPNYLTSPEGLIARTAAKKKLVEEVRDERGLFDFFFGGDRPSQKDIEKMSFEGWQLEDSLLGPRMAQKGVDGNYVYVDNLDEDTAYIIEQLIRMDNPEDYPDQQRQSLRTGQ